MKISKFFAAFLGATAFVACTQEEIVSVGSTPQEMEKVVGARLVGTDVSLNAYVAGSESATRWAGGTKGWESGDIVGLGWLVQEKSVNGATVPDISGTQSETATPQSYLYANHMYEYDEMATKWGTKGNLYEGWYFGYYPWSYEEKAGKMKTYVLNPDMLAAGSAYHVSQSLYLTNRQFIDADEDLDVETNSLKPSFEMYQAVKFIQVTTNAEAGSAFADDEKEGGLDELPIKSISISVGNSESKIFAESVKLSAKNLPVKVEYPAEATDEEKAAIDVQNLKNFREAYGDFMYSPVWKNVVERNVEAAAHSVSTENARVYFNVIPGVKSFETENVTITVTTGAGDFIIRGEKYNELSAINKAAIDALVNAYKEGGVLSTINELDEAGNPKANLSILNLNIELCDENYSTDFTKISTFTEWESAVNSVQTLKRSEAEFTIVGDIEFDGGKILMPTNTEFTKLTVTTDTENPKQIVLNSGTFDGVSEKLDISAVEVMVAAGATVAKAHTISAAAIHNYGTLNVPAYTGEQDKMNPVYNTLTGVTNYTDAIINLEGNYAKVAEVDNSLGRINIVYGSFVELQDGTEAGVIAYQVLEDDVTNPIRIKYVVDPKGNKTGTALVNTLVFDTANEIEAFDFTYVETGSEGSDDPYNPSDDVEDKALTFEDLLDHVNLEINGVNVYSSMKDQMITVGNVQLANADLGQNISVGGDLTITEGTVNVITNGTIGTEGTGNVTVLNGTVIVNAADILGAVTIAAGTGAITSADGIASVEIKAGNFTVNAKTIEGAVTASGENYFNVEEFKGSVEMTNTSSNAIAIAGATFNENVTLTGTYGLVDAKIDGDLTINGGTESAPVKLLNVTVSGNLTVKGGYVVANNVNIKGDLTVEAGSYILSADEYTTIKNIVVKKGALLTANSDVYVNTIAVYGHVKVASGKVVWFTVPVKQNGYIQEGITEGKVLPSSMTVDGDNYTISGADGMEALAALVNAGTSFAGKTITLSEDIDLKDIEWEPIGSKSKSKPFEGTFDGAGKSIKNLVIDNGTTNDTGLFGYVQGTKSQRIEIKNVVLENVNVKGGWRTGGLIGNCGNYTTVSDITVTGLVQIDGYSDVGAVVGATCKTIKNVTVNALDGSYVKSAAGTVGGVAGLLIENHHADGITSNINVIATNVDGTGNTNSGVGGIFGCANGYGTKITDCSSSGNVTILNATTEALAMKIGGIAGGKHGGKLTLAGCSYTGQLNSSFNGTAIKTFYGSNLVGDNQSSTTIN